MELGLSECHDYGRDRVGGGRRVRRRRALPARQVWNSQVLRLRQKGSGRRRHRGRGMGNLGAILASFIVTRKRRAIFQSSKVLQTTHLAAAEVRRRGPPPRSVSSTCSLAAKRWIDKQNRAQLRASWLTQPSKSDTIGCTRIPICYVLSR